MNPQFTFNQITGGGRFEFSDGSTLEFDEMHNRGLRWRHNDDLVARDVVEAMLALNAHGLSVIEDCIRSAARFVSSESKLTAACLRSARELIYLPKKTNTAPKQLNSISVDELYTGSAVYFLSRRGEVCYVGQTHSLPKRISQHLADKSKKFDSVYYMEVPSQMTDSVERAWIHNLHPEYNKQ